MDLLNESAQSNAQAALTSATKIVSARTWSSTAAAIEATLKHAETIYAWLEDRA